MKTALFRDPNVSGFDVHVNTFRGDVQLSVFVDTPEQKEHAAAIAREKVAGVQSVANDIEVKPGRKVAVGTPGTTVENSSRTVTGTPAADLAPSPAPLRTDTDRFDDRTQLNGLGPTCTYPAGSPVNPARNIEIQSVNGRAILRGTVPTEDEKRSIARKLLSVPGVVSVDNQLLVEPVPALAYETDEVGTIKKKPTKKKKKKKKKKKTPHCPSWFCACGRIIQRVLRVFAAPPHPRYCIGHRHRSALSVDLSSGAVSASGTGAIRCRVDNEKLRIPGRRAAISSGGRRS